MIYTKKIFAVFALTIFATGCSKHKKPENEIQEYIQKNIANPSSYVPVSFGKLSTDSSNAINDPQYLALNDSIKNWKKSAATEVHDPAQFQFQPATKMSYLDKIFQAENQQYTIINNFKPRPCGFVMKHVFKKQNTSGNVVLDSLNFHFDSSMNLRDDDEYAKHLNND